MINEEKNGLGPIDSYYRVYNKRAQCNFPSNNISLNSLLRTYPEADIFIKELAPWHVV